MDSSFASIVAALITAAASVIVALIGRASPQRAKRRGKPERAYMVPATNKRVWIIGILILSLWLVLSPTLIHWDLAGSNFFLIFIVTLPLSGTRPIKPWEAAAIVLMLYSANFFMEPLGWWVHGIGVYSPLSSDPGYFLFVLGLGFVNALGAYGLARLRAHKFAEAGEVEV